MEKYCKFCEQKINVKVQDGMHKVLVNRLNNYICSNCAMNLFDFYYINTLFIDYEGNDKHYGQTMSSIVKTIVEDYTDTYKEEIDDFLVSQTIEALSYLGYNITGEEAEKFVATIKKDYDTRPEKYLQIEEKIRLEEQASLAVKSITTVTKPVVTEEVGKGTEEDMLPEVKSLRERREKVGEIVEEVKLTVRGQDDAVDAIGRVFYHNISAMIYNMEKDSGTSINKQNMIIVGPTGTGKTETLKTYCDLLGLPYVIVDMTSYTQAGFVGNDIENIFKSLINQADGDIELAQRGIVIMDEGDKNEPKESSTGRDVNGKGILDSLLKKIEGTDIDLGNGQVFNSTETTFATLGVYPKLYDIRKERVVGKRKIGFDAGNDEINDYGTFLPIDFKKHGFTDEYIARFSSIIELKPLTDDIYVDILRNAKKSPYKQYKALFKYFQGADLIITPEGEKSIIEKTKVYNVGARGLYMSLTKVLEEIEEKFMKEPKSCKQIIVDKDCEVKIN